MTDQKLPQDLDEQAMLYALGLLDPEDRQAFRVRLQGESALLRQTAAAYQTTVATLASTVVPVAPPPALRERLVQQVASEAAREAQAFELTANTLAMGVTPMKPPRSLRDQLLSRVEQQAAAQHDVKEAPLIRTETTVSRGDGLIGSCREASAHGMADSRDHRHSEALSKIPGTLLKSGWRSLVNFVRTAALRLLTSKVVQPSGEGMTFVKATEGVWLTLAPGVTAKVLSFDSISRRATSLVRFTPGTSYAPHRHAAAEELFVLEGGCVCAGQELRAGDYHRADAGTVHHDTSSDDGCLLLVISSSQNEMLP